MNDNRMHLIDFLIKNKDFFSIHSTLDLIEHVYELPIEALLPNNVKLQGSVNISTSASDINEVKIRKDKVILSINNVGLLGIQGAMPMWYVEEVFRLGQVGDNVLRDFIDIFNHRIIQNLHRIRKSCYFNYYSTEMIKNSYSLFIEKKQFLSLSGESIFGSRICSAFTLSKLIQSLVGQDVVVQIEKTIGRWIPIDHCKFPFVVGKGILGNKAWINDKVVVTLKCSSRYKYEQILKTDSLDQLISQYCAAYSVEIRLEKSAYRTIFLGQSRLMLGICL